MDCPLFQNIPHLLITVYLNNVENYKILTRGRKYYRRRNNSLCGTVQIIVLNKDNKCLNENGENENK